MCLYGQRRRRTGDGGCRAPRSPFPAFPGMPRARSTILSDDLGRADWRDMIDCLRYGIKYCSWNCICLRDLHRRGLNLDVILIALINQPAPCVLVDSCVIRRTGCLPTKVYEVRMRKASDIGGGGSEHTHSPGTVTNSPFIGPRQPTKSEVRPWLEAAQRRG